MRYVRFLLVLTVAASAVDASATAQADSSAPQNTMRDHPVRGVVWDVPDVKVHAEADLAEMHRIGVEAVRVAVIRDDDLLVHADTLGLMLYVDLPVSHVPSRRLNDTLAYASAVLDTVLGLARLHPSIRHIGLASFVDSSDSTACAYFQDLATQVRRHGPPGMQVYYVTRFVESDRCAGVVDFVLADVRDVKDPIRPLRQWTVSAEGRSSRLGLGALGKWVRADTLSGLRVPSSPEAQARYFEHHLPVLLSDTLSVSLPAVFVFRWRDVQRTAPSTARDLESPYVQRYGLSTVQNIRRPAYEVIEGIYTGSRQTFAFSIGHHAPDGAPWTTLFGWGVIVLLGTFYALSPRFRHMVPRYFTAHFFYRDAVREGRDVLFGASTVLLISLGAAFGVTAAVLVGVLRETAPFVVAVWWLPTAFQGVVLTLLAQPWVLVILAGCTYALGIILWTIVLSLISQRRYPIAPGQALMLAVWPRWPLLVVMMGAIVVATSDVASSTVAFALAGSWIVVSAVATVRTVIDFVLVTRVPPPLAVPSLILYPGVVVAVGMALLLFQYEPELRYLWHLATRT